MSSTAKGKYVQWLEPDGLLRLTAWARDGLTNEQIAHNMGINPKTLWEWCTKYDQISKALKRGKEVVDIEVENALYRRAVGYDYTETITETSAGQTKEKVFVRHMPPDVTAQIYWLNNRKPEQWRNRKASESDQPNVALEKAKEILGGVRSAID